MFSSLQQRSSWASAVATGLVGWNSFFIILALALGYHGSATALILLASLNGVVQAVALKACLTLLRLDRGLVYGAVWGAITGGLLVGAELPFVLLFRQHPILWILNGVYIGPAVGAFLSYFYRDDKKIHDEAKLHGTEVEYGRDAHWLEPFGFGAVVYLIAFVPRSLDLAIFVLIVGAMVGVFAAGASHFSGDRFKTSLSANVLFVIIGSGFGLASGLLFRQFQDQLFASHILLGMVAGMFTFLVTFVRGRVLSRTQPA